MSQESEPPAVAAPTPSATGGPFTNAFGVARARSFFRGLSMHIHPPKPLHGWRAFIGEIGVIVIGVLIALSAEQVVETLHWQHMVEAENESLNEEVSGNYGSMLVRVLMQPCIDLRLTEIGEVLRRHDAGQPLGLAAPIGRPTVFGASKSALAMATADQSLAHMTMNRKRELYAQYSAYDAFAPIADEERSAWRTLQSLDRAATFDKDDWREVRRAFDSATDANSVMKTNLHARTSGQWLSPFRNIPVTREDMAGLARQVRSLPYVQKLCRPALK